MDSEDGSLVDTPVTWIFDNDDDGFELDDNPGIAELRPGQ